jgi:hypothetical protein
VRHGLIDTSINPAKGVPRLGNVTGIVAPLLKPPC